MPIHTEEEYHPVMNHPIYVSITLPEQNKYTLWDNYEIRVPDEENGDDGPYNYVYDAILVGKSVEEWGEIPDIFKGYVAKSKHRDEIENHIHPLGEDGEFDDDDKVAVLTFLRKGATKRFITSDAQHPQAVEQENTEIEHQNS